MTSQVALNSHWLRWVWPTFIESWFIRWQTGEEEAAALIQSREPETLLLVSRPNREEIDHEASDGTDGSHVLLLRPCRSVFLTVISLMSQF